MSVQKIIADGLKKFTASDILDKIAPAIDSYSIKLKAMDESMYWMLKDFIHVAINGQHFSKEVADMAVRDLIYADGASGEYWDIATTSSVAPTFDKFNEYDWYYVMNMLYSDYCVAIGKDANTYVSLSKAWINDIDAPEGKAYLYWKMIITNK